MDWLDRHMRYGYLYDNKAGLGRQISYLVGASRKLSSVKPTVRPSDHSELRPKEFICHFDQNMKLLQHFCLHPGCVAPTGGIVAGDHTKSSSESPSGPNAGLWCFR